MDEYDDHVVAKRLNVSVENPNAIYVPNIQKNNHEHWKTFIMSPCIRNSDHGMNCGICGLKFTPHMPGHAYRFQTLKSAHSVCMFIHLNLCGCPICKQMFDLLINVIQSFKKSIELREANVFEAVYDNIEEKMQDYWLLCTNDISLQFSDIVGNAVVLNLVVAVDDLVPDVDNPPKKVDPVFVNNRHCMVTSSLKKIYFDVIKNYCEKKAAFTKARKEGKTPLPENPSEVVLVTGLDSALRLFLCIDSVRRIVVTQRTN